MYKIKRRKWLAMIKRNDSEEIMERLNDLDTAIKASLVVIQNINNDKTTDNPFHGPLMAVAEERCEDAVKKLEELTKLIDSRTKDS